MLANLDGDTEAAFRAALDKLKSAGVTVVDVEMPKLAELNGQVGFPVALYEAYDDMVAYLKHTGTRRQHRGAGQADREPRREGHL